MGLANMDRYQYSELPLAQGDFAERIWRVEVGHIPFITPMEADGAQFARAILSSSLQPRLKLSDWPSGHNPVERRCPSRSSRNQAESLAGRPIPFSPKSQIGQESKLSPRPRVVDPPTSLLGGLCSVGPSRRAVIGYVCRQKRDDLG